MALVDTLDNLLMVGAYGWAFNKPQRKLYYNMTITGTSVVVALFIGGLEALGLLMDKFALSGGIWDAVGAVNDNLGNAGFVGGRAVCRLLADLHGQLPLARLRCAGGELLNFCLNSLFCCFVGRVSAAPPRAIRRLSR